MQRTSLIAALILDGCLGTDGNEDTEHPNTDDAQERGTGLEDRPDLEDSGSEDADADGAGAAPVVPSSSGGRWNFSAGALVLEVEPAAGARIARLALAGTELLTDATIDADNWGATFWTSPQADWGWPPPGALDAEPWTAVLDGGTLTLGSAPFTVGDATWVAEKAITVTNIVTITYTIRNIGASSKSIAGWQVTRVPAEGITLFPAGAYVRATVGDLAHAEAAGLVWIADIPAADAKLLADGSQGWIAHVANGVLLTQRFPDLRSEEAAPGEAEIEVFANGGGGYREVEVQGAGTTLAPGQALTWTVTWDARAVPEEVDVAVGSPTLAAWAAARAPAARVGVSPPILPTVR